MREVGFNNEYSYLKVIPTGDIGINLSEEWNTSFLLLFVGVSLISVLKLAN